MSMYCMFLLMNTLESQITFKVVESQQFPGDQDVCRVIDSEWA